MTTHVHSFKMYPQAEWAYYNTVSHRLTSSAVSFAWFCCRGRKRELRLLPSNLEVSDVPLLVPWVYGSDLNNKHVQPIKTERISWENHLFYTAVIVTSIYFSIDDNCVHYKLYTHKYNCSNLETAMAVSVVTGTAYIMSHSNVGCIQHYSLVTDIERKCCVYIVNSQPGNPETSPSQTYL